VFVLLWLRLSCERRIRRRVFKFFNIDKNWFVYTLSCSYTFDASKIDTNLSDSRNSVGLIAVEGQNSGIMDTSHLTLGHCGGKLTLRILLSFVGCALNVINDTLISICKLDTGQIFSILSIEYNATTWNTSTWDCSNLVHRQSGFWSHGFSFVSCDMSAQSHKFTRFVFAQLESCHAIECVELFSIA